MTSTSYKELLAQRDALERQIAEARNNEIASAINQIRQLVADYGLTQLDVFPAGRGARTPSKKSGSVAPKYRDPATGQTWTGRGKPPRWIAGHDRAKFEISAA